MSTSTLEQEITARWRRILDSAGRLDGCRDLGADPGSPAGAMQADITDLFVRAEPAERRSYDLCLAVLPTVLGARRADLRFVGPDAIRSRSQPSSSGTAVTDLAIVPAGTELVAVSLLLLRVPRMPRLRDLAASVADLARIGDADDPDGSVAAVDAAVRRLEVLLHSEGVSAALAGDVTAPPVPGHRLLTDPAATTSPTVLDGRLVSAAAQNVSWREADYALVRFGPPRTRGDQGRSLDTLRRESALVEVELEVGAPDEEETYSTRVARARQSSRAEEIVGFARAGDRAGAAQVLRTALAQPGADGPLVESLMSRVSRPEEFWSIRDVLVDVAADPDVAGSQLMLLHAVRSRFERRLDALMGLVPPADGGDIEPLIPVMTPIVLEVGDALVAIVDSNRDGGVFMETLIPQARQRVIDLLGVTLPGIRLRGNPNLPLGAFQLQVHEIPVSTGSVDVDAEYALEPIEAFPPPHDADLSDFHPLTGAPGLFMLAAASADHDRGERLSSAQYLIHRVERLLRQHLHRFLGLQEVTAKLNEWMDDDARLVAEINVDPRSRMRLTWVLQALVEDRVPITDWRAILEAIRAAGGTDAPIRVLRRAARARLRGQLPGPRDDRRLFYMPAELSTDALGPPRIALLEWLRMIVDGAGPAISLVTATQDQRESVAPVARASHPLITTLAAEELDADGG